jgi:hypothetical protein
MAMLAEFDAPFALRPTWLGSADAIRGRKRT